MKYETHIDVKIEVEAKGELPEEGLEKILSQIEGTISKMGVETDKMTVSVTPMGHGTIRKLGSQDESLRESIRRKARE